MKKIFYAAAIIGLMANVSCKKSTDGNKNVLVENSSTASSDSASSSKTERYVAEDGSSALVTFTDNDQENSISIRSNNKTVAAPQKSKTADAGVYGNYDFEIVAKKDTVTITQGDNVIVLKKARGQ